MKRLTCVCGARRLRGKSFCSPCANLKYHNVTGEGKTGRKNFTEEQKQDMRNRLSRFERPLDIAALYNTTAQTIRRITTSK